MTAVCVPLLAITPFLGGAGLAVACALLLAERAGKAVRSPSKSTLLAHAAGHVGMGRGFAVHKALDQVGAFAGPLLVAAVVAVTTAIWPAMAVLALPGAVALGLLVWMRLHIPDPVVPAESAPVTRTWLAGLGTGLPPEFLMFAGSAGAFTAGLVTFGLIAFHLTGTHLVPVAAVPVVYAAAMATAALAALASGYLYDRWSARVLLTLPPLVAAVPALALSSRVGTAVAGVLVWGAAVGVQDSTVKALVADLVPSGRRASAYGVFAAVQGSAALAGGVLAGALYTRSISGLVVVIGVLQLGALVLLAVTLHRHRAL